jgi:hypothetical protein
MLVAGLSALSLLPISGPVAASTQADPPVLVADSTDEGDTCAMNLEVPRPTNGNAALASVTVDPQTCEVVGTELAEVDPGDFEAPEASESRDEEAAGIGPEQVEVQIPQLPVICHGVRARQWIEDPIAIVLTGLDMQLNWCDTGAGGIITSYAGSARSRWHVESIFPGWIPAGNTGAVIAGGAGQSFLRYRAANAFSYRGVFDPTGLLYFNSHATVIRVSTNNPGAADCTFSYATMKWPNGLWTHKVYCGP